MSQVAKVTPRCDVPGCGMMATRTTDGTEVDSQAAGRPELKPRPAVACLNVCERHENWPHSGPDVAKFIANNQAEYDVRKAQAATGKAG